MNVSARVVGFFITLVGLFFSSTIPSPCQEGPSTVPLIEALRQGDLQEARKILHSGTKLNVRDNYGDTPLEQAIRSRFTDFAEELLSAGADPMFTDVGRGTSLMVAASMCDLEIARKLLDRGVPVSASDVKGETALMPASQICLDGKMVQLLLDAGANPNTKSEGDYTALMSAAHSGNLAATEKLLQAGADPTVKNKYGETAEDKACKRQVGRNENHDRICVLLREAAKR